MKPIFLDSHNAVTEKQLRVKAGSYAGLYFRFNIDQAAATQFTATDLGTVEVRYKGLPKQRWTFNELASLNDLKFGKREDTDAGAGGVHTSSFYVPLVHWDARKSVVSLSDDTQMYVDWIPASTLAAKVDTIELRMLGDSRFGKFDHILGARRQDIAMVSGQTRPEVLAPYNVSNVFVEYNTNIDYLTLDVDSKSEVKPVEIIELLGMSTLSNRIETFAASGYAEIDLLENGGQWNEDVVARALNNHVEIGLTGGGADTISVFWVYLDAQINELAISEAHYRQELQQRLQRKANAGGSAAVALYSATAINPKMEA